MANYLSLTLTNFKYITDNLDQKKLFHNFIQLVMVHDLKFQF